MDLLKKLPIPIAGLILAMFALGNLLQAYSNVVRLCIGGVALILYVIFVLKIVLLNLKLKTVLDNPVVASVLLTSTMATMLISTYVKSYISSLAVIIWFIGVILHVLLMAWFSFKFISNFSIKKVFPSWYIVYVGIATASVSAGAVGQLRIGQICFWFALASYLVLIPVVCFRVFKVKEIPEPAKPTFAILSAPGSLVLAGYLVAFPQKNFTFATVLFAISVFFYIIVLLNMPNLVKLKFSPGFSGFTFPLVISAVSSKLFTGYVMALHGKNLILKYFVNFQEIVAVLIVLYVFIGYMKFLLEKES
ncbi:MULTISPECIES: TDT family transporter [unclassified Parvimonas]|uniref:TDT family transporter n=1 Tax=unclassified Parvimonas TaxID=1151464 RepID=UPI002B48DD83|nr:MULTISPECIES: TDT family transporter [unclassified Parvimonas]MEB3025389.1 TDT family transporter [Parvimonas sp. M13]MEB3089563.1 TDT family transporter [Parvimonas sp. M20]